MTRLCIGPIALFPTNTTLSKISLSEIAHKPNELQDQELLCTIIIAHSNFMMSFSTIEHFVHTQNLQPCSQQTQLFLKISLSEIASLPNELHGRKFFCTFIIDLSIYLSTSLRKNQHLFFAGPIYLFLTNTTLLKDRSL